MPSPIDPPTVDDSTLLATSVVAPNKTTPYTMSPNPLPHLPNPPQPLQHSTPLSLPQHPPRQSTKRVAPFTMRPASPACGSGSGHIHGQDEAMAMMKSVRSTRRPSTAPTRVNVTWSAEHVPMRYSQVTRSKPSLNTLEGMTSQSVEEVGGGGGGVGVPGVEKRETHSGLLNGLRLNVEMGIAEKGSISALPTVLGGRGGEVEVKVGRKKGTAKGSGQVVGFMGKQGSFHVKELQQHGDETGDLKLRAGPCKYYPTRPSLPTTLLETLPHDRPPVPHDHTAQHRGSHPHRCRHLPTGTLLPHLIRRTQRTASFGVSNRIEFLLGMREERILSPLGLTSAGSAGDEIRILAPCVTFGKMDGREVKGREGLLENVKVAERLRKKLKEVDARNARQPKPTAARLPNSHTLSIKDILSTEPIQSFHLHFHPPPRPQQAPRPSTPPQIPTRYSSNKDWYKNTMYITQCIPGSDFYVDERDRLEREPFFDVEREIKRERYQMKMVRMGEELAKRGVSTIVLGGE
ncbi:hypothetical protein BC829DRAFT_402979 [Chytridium lagenaria]|nr:hypothetical protein BC829DRAFT_402979 [Chytridium lagenaria]